MPVPSAAPWGPTTKASDLGRTSIRKLRIAGSGSPSAASGIGVSAGDLQRSIGSGRHPAVAQVGAGQQPRQHPKGAPLARTDRRAAGRAGRRRRGACGTAGMPLPNVGVLQVEANSTLPL
jgi:hypothetical protein